MDTITIYHYMITAIDVVILYILGKSFARHHKGRNRDMNYHTRWLLVCTCLLLANTFALITSIYSYYIIHTDTHEIINFGRFADRYCMVFSYYCFNKIEDRY